MGFELKPEMHPQITSQTPPLYNELLMIWTNHFVLECC